MHIRKCKRKLNVLVLLPSTGMNSFHGSGFGGKVLLSFVLIGKYLGVYCLVGHEFGLFVSGQA